MIRHPICVAGDREPIVSAPLSGVLFDMDGVICDTQTSVAAFWNGLAAEYALALSADDFKVHIHGRAAQHTLDALFSTLSLAQRDAIFAQLRVKEMSETYQPVGGLIRFVRELDAAGVPCGVVTSAEPWKARRVLEALGLHAVFRAIITSVDVARGKPAPDGYLAGAEALALRSHRALVFEDAVSGVQAAKASRAVCVGVGVDDRALRDAGAIAVIADFTDVATAAAPGGGLTVLIRGCPFAVITPPTVAS